MLAEVGGDVRAVSTIVLTHAHPEIDADGAREIAEATGRRTTVHGEEEPFVRNDIGTPMICPTKPGRLLRRNIPTVPPRSRGPWWTAMSCGRAAGA